MSTNITRRQLLGAGASALGAGLALAGCAGDSESATTAAPGTTSGPDDAGAAAPSSTDVTAVDTTPAPAATAATTVDTANAPASTAATTTESDPAALTSGTPGSTVFTTADFAGLGACFVFPELTAGPFPSLELMERRDITEGMTGHPLRVGIQVVDESCSPVPGARVEIWHCDVDGDYSSYQDGATADDAGEGTTFYRGYQTANADGIV
ncbi:MAG TPA: hypothetical protein VNO51_16800, partial [Ilumatobacteraceae bacterium]|nr:hypothetical protein [Ilumatobacteraceae bacterium]